MTLLQPRCPTQELAYTQTLYNSAVIHTNQPQNTPSIEFITSWFALLILLRSHHLLPKQISPFSSSSSLNLNPHKWLPPIITSCNLIITTSTIIIDNKP
ncbi:hypothetical protein G4B88_000190 [Cannabis sativa]|uniref:Uncharacterized protein n=1 Tax=Cannabis sativa TaxID=3483 RepID=A0A7J6GPE7_CANSA|nr:hypothetical protein G4B88_000190 [Cannabis sativa]